MQRLAIALALAAVADAGRPRAEEPAPASGRPPLVVAVLVAEQGVEDGSPVAWWKPRRPRNARGPSDGPPRAAEAALVSEWQPAGFRFATLDPLARRLASAGIGPGDLSAAQARAAGRIAGCGVVIHGTAVATSEDEASGMLEQGSGLKPVAGRTCVATVALRAHRADTGEVVAAGEATARSSERNPAVCGRSAMGKAGREVAAALQERVLAFWRQRP